MSSLNRNLRIYSFGVKNESLIKIKAWLHFENAENLKVNSTNVTMTKVRLLDHRPELALIL